MDYEGMRNLIVANPDGIPAETSKEYLTHEIVILIFCLIGLCIDILMIYTIFYFDKMRTVSNVIIANWLIADLCCIIVTPSFYQIISVIGNFFLPYNLMCSIFELSLIFRSLELLFAVVLAIDWLSSVHFPRVSEKIKSYYRYIIAFLWIISVIISNTFVGLCVGEVDKHDVLKWVPLLFYSLLVILVVIALFTIGIHKRSRDSLEYTTHPVTLTISLIITYIVILIPAGSMLQTVATCMVRFDIILIFLILYSFDRDFKANLWKIGRSNNPYSDSLHTRNSNSVNDVHVDLPVNIAFHSPTEELITNSY